MAMARAVFVADGMTIVGHVDGGGSEVDGVGDSLGTLGVATLPLVRFRQRRCRRRGSEYTFDWPHDRDPRAFRWTASGGMVNLGTLNGGKFSLCLRCFGRWQRRRWFDDRRPLATSTLFAGPRQGMVNPARSMAGRTPRL